jgi:hypothetical protein
VIALAGPAPMDPASGRMALAARIRARWTAGGETNLEV